MYSEGRLVICELESSRTTRHIYQEYTLDPLSDDVRNPRDLGQALSVYMVHVATLCLKKKTYATPRKWPFDLLKVRILGGTQLSSEDVRALYPKDFWITLKQTSVDAHTRNRAATREDHAVIFIPRPFTISYTPHMPNRSHSDVFELKWKVSPIWLVHL